MQNRHSVIWNSGLSKIPTIVMDGYDCIELAVILSVENLSKYEV